MTANIEFKEALIDTIRPDPRNARTHSKKQVDQIAASIAANGFVNPVLVNPDGTIIAGHGRLRAARKLGLTSVPIIVVSGLSAAQERCLRIADNKIALNSGWDNDLLKIELLEINAAGIDLDLTGFSTGEIDVLCAPKIALIEPHDPVPATAVSQRGDIWLCGEHRVGCGDVLDGSSLPALMAGVRADAIASDPPYNTANATHNGGSGRFRHREFQYAHGEMSNEEFTRFLTDTQSAMAQHCRDGAVAFIFMDHHHAGEQIAAGASVFGRRLNIAVWIKSNAGMGSLYRSQHEMIFIYVVGTAGYTNNVELGRHGRNRTNVWSAPSVNTFGSRQGDLELHATVKPTQLIADMIMDVTKHGDVVLDCFLGSGTTLLAAARTKRRAYGLEIDPAYVDVAVTRWMELTGMDAVLEDSGESFTATKRRRDEEFGSASVEVAA